MLADILLVDLEVQRRAVMYYSTLKNMKCDQQSCVYNDLISTQEGGHLETVGGPTYVGIPGFFFLLVRCTWFPGSKNPRWRAVLFRHAIRRWYSRGFPGDE